MTIFSRSFACLAILPLVPVVLGLAQATSVETGDVRREIIEQRLRRFSRSNWTRQAELGKIFEGPVAAPAGCLNREYVMLSLTALTPARVK